jgi:hypothetical protein
VSRAVLRSLWGCLHVDWCYLGSIGASVRMLLMRNKRVVEKIEECGSRAEHGARMHGAGICGYGEECRTINKT